MDQDNLIMGGWDTFYFNENLFKIVRNITEKGGEGAAAVPPHPHPINPPYSLKSDDYCVTLLPGVIFMST